MTLESDVDDMSPQVASGVSHDHLIGQYLFRHVCLAGSSRNRGKLLIQDFRQEPVQACVIVHLNSQLPVRSRESNVVNGRESNIVDRRESNIVDRRESSIVDMSIQSGEVLLCQDLASIAATGMSACLFSSFAWMHSFSLPWEE